MMSRMRLRETCLLLRYSVNRKMATVKNASSFSPVPISIGGKRFLAEELTAEDMTTASTLFIQASSSGDGYGVDQFNSETDVASFLNAADICLKISMDKTVLGVFGIGPCSLTRSQTPLYRNSFIFLDISIRGKGLSSALLRSIHPLILNGTSLLTRTGVMGSASSLVKTGWTCLGVIPGSMKLPDKSFVDDLIVCSSQDIENDRKTPMSKEDLTLPPLRRSTILENKLSKPFPRQILLPSLHIGERKYKVQFAANNDLWLVEEMMREAALDGNGFALDEFTSDGHLNRFLLKETHVLVFKDDEGQVKAAVVFGPSDLCRETNLSQLAGYMVVEKGSRGKGVGNGLLTYCMENAHLFGGTRLLIDVFASNHIMLNMLLKRRFLCTGTIPNCGFIANRGRTDSLVFFRQI